jgi:sulfatase maturation enzyme AslB (radical SAM superfamily)
MNLRSQPTRNNSHILVPAPDCFVLVRDDDSWHLFDEPFDASRITDYEAFSLEIRPRVATRPRQSQISMIVFVSEACNLRCDYCKVAAMVQAVDKTRTRPDRIAKSIIDASERTSGPVDVIFYGGEPLLEYRAIEQICDTILNALPWAQINFSMTTNGTLLNTAIIDVLLRHRISVGVSIDGNAEMHDHARVNAGGRGTHSKVIQNYAAMKRAGVSCGPISVISDPSQLQDIFAYFNSQFGDRHIHLKPLEVQGTEDHGALRAYFAEFADQQLTLLERNIRHFMSTTNKQSETRTNGVVAGILLSYDLAVKGCRTSGQGPQQQEFRRNCSIGFEIEGVEADGRRMPCPNVKKYANTSVARIAEISSRGGYCDGCRYQQVCPSFCLAEMDETFVDQFLAGHDTKPVDVICGYNRQLIDGIFNLYRAHPIELSRYAAAQ